MDKKMTENALKGAGKGEYLFVDSRSVTWKVTLETSVLKSKKAQNSSTIQSSYTAFMYTPKDSISIEIVAHSFSLLF